MTTGQPERIKIKKRKERNPWEKQQQFAHTCSQRKLSTFEKGKTEERDRNINGESKCFVCATLIVCVETAFF